MKIDNRCEVYPHYRVCMIKETLMHPGGRVEIICKVGYFHKWFVHEQQVVGVVELSNGEVMLVSSKFIEFIDDIHDKLEVLSKDVDYAD